MVGWLEVLLKGLNLVLKAGDLPGQRYRRLGAGLGDELDVSTELVLSCPYVSPNPGLFGHVVSPSHSRSPFLQLFFDCLSEHLGIQWPLEHLKDQGIDCTLEVASINDPRVVACLIAFLLALGADVGRFAAAAAQVKALSTNAAVEEAVEWIQTPS